MKTRLIILFLWALCALNALAQETITLRVLAIGNSFSEDAVEHYLYELGRECGYNLIIGNAYRPGQGLASHWHDVTSRTNSFEFRKIVDGKRTNRPRQSLRDIVTDEAWDVITLQQVSQESGLAESYEPGLSLLIGYVRALALSDSMRLGLHQTWAYAQDSDHKGFANYSRNQFLMYSYITTAVEQAVHNHTEDISFYIPSGTAIQNARTSSLDTYSANTDPLHASRELTRDGYHLDLKIGRYIAACTWLEAITGVNPVGLKTRPTEVSKKQARIAQEAAHAAMLVPMAVTPIVE